jgi:hypothetical protein
VPPRIASAPRMPEAGILNRSDSLDPGLQDHTRSSSSLLLWSWSGAGRCSHNAASNSPRLWSPPGACHSLSQAPVPPRCKLFGMRRKSAGLGCEQYDKSSEEILRRATSSGRTARDPKSHLQKAQGGGALGRGAATGVQVIPLPAVLAEVADVFPR